MDEDILKTIRDRGLLLERDVFDLLNEIKDKSVVKELLEGLERFSGQKIITKSTLNKNFEFVKGFVNKLSDGSKESIERYIVKLGLSLEITKEKFIPPKEETKGKKGDYQIFYADTKADKKLEVKDFVGHFRSRYQQLQRMLMQRPDLRNLTSINKISGERQSICIIGMVSEKRITKNKNLIVRFEDLTGEISVLFKHDNEEMYNVAEELQLDDVVAVKCSGNNDFLFAHELFFPDSFIYEKVKFEEDSKAVLLEHAQHGGELRHGTAAEQGEFTRRVSEMLQMIASNSEYQFC